MAQTIVNGMTVNRWLLQFLSDCCQLNIEKPNFSEATAFGAAMLAGLGVGIFSSIEDIEKRFQIENYFKPQLHSNQIGKNYHTWQQAVTACQNFTI